MAKWVSAGTHCGLPMIGFAAADMRLRRLRKFAKATDAIADTRLKNSTTKVPLADLSEDAQAANALYLRTLSKMELHPSKERHPRPLYMRASLLSDDEEATEVSGGGEVQGGGCPPLVALFAA